MLGAHCKTEIVDESGRNKNDVLRCDSYLERVDGAPISGIDGIRFERYATDSDRRWLPLIRMANIREVRKFVSCGA